MNFRTSGSPTIINLSFQLFNTKILLSHLTWQESLHPIIFNTHTSYIEFEHCMLNYTIFQLTGIKTNLTLSNTTLRNSKSTSFDIPLFFLYTMESFYTNVILRNSSFTHNQSPVLLGLQMGKVLTENTLFSGNQNNMNKRPFLTFSGKDVVIKNSRFLSNSVLEVRNVKNFTIKNVLFFLNNAIRESCLIVKQRSNVFITDTFFNKNTNPVIVIDKTSNALNQIVLQVRFHKLLCY